jgi:hypothetical protein
VPRTRRVSLGFVLAALAATGCDRTSAPPTAVPSHLTAVGTPASSVTVGQVAGPVAVRVTDAVDAPLAGIPVMFVVSAGAGQLSRTADTTNADGVASAVFTAGTQRAANEVSAIVDGLPAVRFAVTSVEGVTRFIVIGTRDLRIPAGLTTATTSAIPRDTFLNATTVPVTWAPRDSTLVDVLVSVNNQVRVTAKRRPGQTWVVGSVAGITDSLLATVQSATEPCAFLATPVALQLGESVELPSGTACFHADADVEEFTLVGHYNTAVSNASALVSVTANGISVADMSFPPTAIVAPDVRDLSFESALRNRESREVAPYVRGARAWYGSRLAARRGNE